MSLHRAIAALALLPFAQAQPDARPRFDVASIKPNAPGGINTGDFRVLPGGRLTAEKVLLRFLIQNAYGVRPFQLKGGPDWINSEGYDIEAKAEGNPSNGQMVLMMQTLLEDRFKLKVHRETKELPVYALTVAKGGFKLPEPKQGACTAPDPNGPPLPPSPNQAGPCGRAMIRISKGVARINGYQVPMREFVRVLSNIMGRTIIDQTGFTRAFDLQLEFATDDAIAGLPEAPKPADDSVPSIFVAAQEQLGIKIVSTKGPVEILVIDHIEKPDMDGKAAPKN
jgi:uncharacterized protein (TIGR03435 family)